MVLEKTLIWFTKLFSLHPWRVSWKRQKQPKPHAKRYGILGFWQEKGAADVVENLMAMVETKAAVPRNNKLSEIPADELVSGDIIVFKAGDIIPADCLLLTVDHLFIDKAMIIG